MAGRAGNRILLITVVIAFSFSSGFAQSEQERGDVSVKVVNETIVMEEMMYIGSMTINTRFQEAEESRFSEILRVLNPDFSLEISYNNRNLKALFLEDNLILSDRGFGDQFLYSVDFTPSVIFLDRYSLEFTYSSIPDQSNFPGSSVLSFETERIILNEVNRYSGHAVSISSAYSQPITESIFASLQLGVTRMRLNVDETLQYHPDDPFARNYSIVTLPFSKRLVTYSNPFIGLSAEFQLQSIRLRTGYQLQLYEFDEVSSSNFYISMGVRLRDLF